MIRPKFFYEFGYIEENGKTLQKDIYIDAYTEGEDIDLWNLLKIEK